MSNKYTSATAILNSFSFDLKKLRSFLISLVFTVVILYFLITNISFGSLWNSLKSIPLQTLVIVFFVHVASYVLRSLVFYKLFKKKDDIGLFYLTNVHFIHNFYVHTIPASLGEVSFPLLLRKKAKPEESIPVLLIARLLFLIMILLIFPIAVLLNFDITTSVTTDYSYLLWGLLLIPALLIIFYLRSIVRLLNRSIYFRKIKIRIQLTYRNLREDIHQLRKPGLLFQVVLFTLLNIVMLTVKYMLLLEVMGLHLNFFQIIFVSSIGIAFILLPLKSIGGFGTTEGAWAIGMLLLGFSTEEAIHSGFVIHIVDLLNVIILFIAGMIIQNTVFRNES